MRVCRFAMGDRFREQKFEKSKGIVSLGGNADEDCKALYDGDDVK